MLTFWPIQVYDVRRVLRQARGAVAEQVADPVAGV
jgi:hypothetical protein